MISRRCEMLPFLLWFGASAKPKGASESIHDTIYDSEVRYSSFVRAHCSKLLMLSGGGADCMSGSCLSTGRPNLSPLTDRHGRVNNTTGTCLIHPLLCPIRSKSTPTMWNDQFVRGSAVGEWRGQFNGYLPLAMSTICDCSCSMQSVFLFLSHFVVVTGLA